MDPSLQKRPVMLPTGKNLVVSPSPHLSRPESVGRIMALVLLALLPPAAAGVWFFGLKALIVIVLSLVFSLFAEALWCLLVHKPVFATLRDGSFQRVGFLRAPGFRGNPNDGRALRVVRDARLARDPGGFRGG